MRVYAAGAAASRSRWVGRFDPLNLLEVEWVVGRSGIFRLRLANLLDPCVPAKESASATRALLGALRLAMDILPEGERVPGLFDFIESAARGAGKVGTPPLFGLSWGLRLLKAGGWLPSLEGREGEIQTQLLDASPEALGKWSWPERVLEVWYRDMSRRWHAEVGTEMGGVVPARFLESPSRGE